MKTICLACFQIVVFAAVCRADGEVELFGPSISGTYMAEGYKIRFFAGRVSRDAEFDDGTAEAMAREAHRQMRQNGESHEAERGDIKMPLGQGEWAILGWVNESRNKWAWCAVRVVRRNTTQWFDMNGNRNDEESGWEDRRYHADGDSGPLVEFTFADNDNGKLGYAFIDPDYRKRKGDRSVDFPGIASNQKRFRPSEVQDYEIIADTSDRDKAGTNADVWVTLIGEDGSTSEDLLLGREVSNNPNQDPFERAQTDRWQFRLPELGPLVGVFVQHNNQGNRPGWHLAGITVKNFTTRKRWECPCNRWLATDEGDMRIARFLPVEGDR